jgi:2-hydroxychromene-2-carboxylate isomerase
MKRADVWISIGSTYSYLTVLRLPKLAAAEDVELTWRLFDIREIMKRARYTPFADKPAKLRYMWRDIERRCEELGLSWRGPAPYPIADLEHANRLAIAAQEVGLVEGFFQATYTSWMLHHEPPGTEENLTRCAAALGRDLSPIVERARSVEIAERLSTNTEQAVETGVFGAPTLVVDGDLFWGDDRLEAALRFARTGS